MNSWKQLLWYRIPMHLPMPQKSTAVALMTLHSGKGLEVKYVLIVGAEDDGIPTVKHEGNLSDALDEERRLLYVGMTRKHFLHIKWRTSKLIIPKNGAMRKSSNSKPK